MLCAAMAVSLAVRWLIIITDIVIRYLCLFNIFGAVKNIVYFHGVHDMALQPQSQHTLAFGSS